MNNEIVKYQAPAGEIISAKLDPKTQDYWFTVAKFAAGFGCKERTIQEHIQHIFAEGELTRENRVKYKPTRGRPIPLYSLDVLLAVGMRVGSAEATAFRQWAIAELKGRIHKPTPIQSPVVQFMLDRYAVQKNPPPDGWTEGECFTAWDADQPESRAVERGAQYEIYSRFPDEKEP